MRGVPGAPGSARAPHTLGRKHNIAFFAIRGALEPCKLRVIRTIAESPFGVDKGSARVSAKTRSLSLAFDPDRVAFAAIQNILDRKLAALRLTLLPMRILDEPSGPGPAATQPA